jgi:hypothetical protein
MIFEIEQDIVTLLEEFLDIVPKAEPKQMERLERLAPGLVHFDRFTEASNETNIDFYSVENESLNVALSAALQINRHDPITIHRVNYNIGGQALEHKDENSLHTYVIMLEDDFEGGDFYLRGELTNFKKRGQVAYYMGMDAPHRVTKILKGSRKVLVVWYADKK